MLLLLVALSPQLAAAQPAPPEPSAADRATARAMMDEGRTQERAGDDTGALKAYLAADKLMGVPSTGLSVGKTQARLGKLVEAVDVLLRVARHPHKPGEPKPYTSARQEAAALAAQLGPRIPSLQIELAGVAPGTTVTVAIDGVMLPQEVIPFPRKVNPGMRVVVGSAPGYREARQTVNVTEGEQQTLRLELEPAPAGEGADEAAAGGISPLVWIGFGVGAAGILVGGITGGMAAGKSSELDQDCPNKVCPPDRESDIDTMKTLAHSSTVGFVVGGLGVGLGVMALLVLSGEGEDETDEEPSASVELAAGPGSLSLTGRF
ncbi:MAG: hypothetical protein JRI68_13885 [Deltaproteobacteria bacterium]|nr:hypothetical protein [Deltaproteobacteria bacterium]